MQPMTLVQLFLQQAAPTMDADGDLHQALEDALWQLVKTGAASWPEIQLAPEDFVRFLAKQLPPPLQEPRLLLSLHARDLYLVSALGQGHRAALLVLETEHMPKVRRVLRKLGTPEPMIADILQSLYNRLLERQNAPPDAPTLRHGYSGRGDLSGWLCTCAVHDAGRRHRRQQRELSLDEAPTVIWGAQGHSPEMALLTGQLKEIFQSVFRDAVESLTSRERNLLRYHFLSELSIDQIGRLYHVHRATAARWVAQARERLITETRKRFLARAPTGAETFPRIVELIRSQITANLAALLKQTTEVDPSIGEH